MNTLQHSITNLLVKHNMLNESDVEWFLYGVQRIAYTASTYTLLFIFGYATLGSLQTICFLASFHFIRKYAGGWHAKTPLRCIAFSFLQEYVCFMLIFPLFSKALIISSILLVIFACGTIFALAPVLPVQMQATKQEEKSNKRFARFITIICSLLTLLLLAFNSQGYSLLCSLGMACAAMSLYLEKFERSFA